MWIKICGVTTVEDARQVAAAAPDAIGLNFYSRSARCVDVETAAAIVRSIPVAIRPVGVFVNESPERIREICHAARIQTVQLHGDEPPETVAALQDFDVIRAYRVGEQGLSHAASELQQFEALQLRLFACLVDSSVPGTYGGTGHRAPWSLLANAWQLDWPPLILAGGITPENTAEAIRSVRPFGIDTASGVELAPGRKDPDAVQRLIATARQGTL